MTGGRGPDVCIDAVGLEAHGHGRSSRDDRVKQTLRLEKDRPSWCGRRSRRAARADGSSLIGVYGGVIDKFPIGAFFGKGLSMRAGQCDVQAFLPRPAREGARRRVRLTSIISHRLTLEDAPHGYEIFSEKKDGCTKVVMRP